MSRRQGNPSRRSAPGAGAGFGALLNKKINTSPFLSIVLTVMGGVFVLGYFFHGSGPSPRDNTGPRATTVRRVEGDVSCTKEVIRALPLLKKTYGGSVDKILHVGPDSCSVVSELLGEEESEGWGIEPYGIEDADRNCKSLVRNGFVRVADIKFSLPYRAKSFSRVIVSDALDYLSPKYLNITLLEMGRISADGVVIFAGFPGHAKSKNTETSKFGKAAKKRSSSWWVRFFTDTSLEENEAASKKFKQAATKASYAPGCQIFHLKSFQ